MRKPHVTPRDTASDFKLHELFFSCTDRRGVILGGNEIFRRVSGYGETELVGAAHNLIRHPDMPRTIFRMFWDYLLQGRPIAAFVKNLAKDGAYYWVLAMATPVEDGFLSVRLKPSSPLLPAVENLYRQMRAREVEGEQRGEADADTYAAVAGLLTAALKKLGHESYDDFMQLALLQTELTSRDRLLAQEQRTLLVAPPAPVPGEPALAAVLRGAVWEANRQAEEFNTLYRRIDEVAEVNGRLRESVRRLTVLTGDFNITSFNIALRASKLGHEGRGIAVIAARLTEISEETSRQIRDLGQRTRAVTERLGQSIFNLAWARVQFEMVAVHYREVLAELLQGEISPGSNLLARRLLMAARLRQGFARTGETTVAALGELSRVLRQFDAHTEELGRVVTTLTVAKVGGLIETSHLQSDDSFASIFADVSDQTRNSQEGFRELSLQVEALLSHSDDAPRLAEAVHAFSRNLEEHERQLGQANTLPAEAALAVSAPAAA
jgi:PAS domain S-box-containing protein